MPGLPAAGNETYMKLKLEGFRKSAVPTRMAKRLDDVVHVKPVANHRYNVSAQALGHWPLLCCRWSVAVLALVRSWGHSCPEKCIAAITCLHPWTLLGAD